MSLFDLLFIAIFPITLILLVVIAGYALCGRSRTAWRLLCILGISLTAYFLVVAVVAVATSQKVLARSQIRCFDEMCFKVTDVNQTSAIGQGQQATRARGTFYLVTIAVSCHGHGHAQSEAGVNVSLVDGAGHTYAVSQTGQRAYEAEYRLNPPLTAHVAPGETVSSVQVFEVPVQAAEVALHVGHSGPDLFIIGDDESSLHKPTIIRLQR